MGRSAGPGADGAPVRAPARAFPASEGGAGIDRVAWQDGGQRAPCHRADLVRGTRADGARGQLEQHMRWVSPGATDTAVAREAVTRAVWSRQRPLHGGDGERGPASVTTRRLAAFRMFGGGGTIHRASGCSAVADVDGDGARSVLAGSGGELFRNRCDGTFVDVTATAGCAAVAGGAPARSSRYETTAHECSSPPSRAATVCSTYGERAIPDVSATAGIATGRGQHGDRADDDATGSSPVRGWHGRPRPQRARPELQRRQRSRAPTTATGDGTFADVTLRAGVGHTGWDLAGAWADYDGDGWPDLYVANEFGDNALYRNQGDGTFRDRAAEAGVTDGGAGMGVAWGDYDGDGDPDLFVSNMHANSAWALFHPDFPAPIPWRYRMLA